MTTEARALPLEDAGRDLAPAAALFANAVAVIGGLTGVLLVVTNLAGFDFNAWTSADPLTPALLGAVMLGVAPGLWAVGRELLWENARTLLLPAVVVVVGLFAISVRFSRELEFHGGGLLTALFSLGWLAVLGALALFGLAALVSVLREPRLPLPVRQPLPGWTKPALAVLGAAWFGLGLGLLVLPDYWGALVPWSVNAVDVAALGVCALAVGVGVLGALTEDDLARCSAAIVGIGGVAAVSALALVVRAPAVEWSSGPGLAVVGLIGGLGLTAAMGRLLRKYDIL